MKSELFHGLQSQPRWLIVALILYFLAFGIARTLISDSLALDEAEQALLSQWWFWGYSAQPPLYTWLQAAVIAVVGDNVAALSVLRQLLLLVTYVFVYLIASRAIKRRAVANAATLALMLIPQIVWENQREHTHSLLALCLAAATLYIALRLLERRSLGGYVALGVAAGLGLLAKYNYVVMASAAIVALSTSPEGRCVLFDRRSLISAALAAIIVGPHLLWLLGHLQVGPEVVSKLHTQHPAQGPAREFGLTMKTIVGFFSPFWIVLVLVFPRSIKPSNWGAPASAEVKFLGRYLLAVFALLIVIVWAFEANQFKERWLQPFFFVAPVWLFAKIAVAYPETRRYEIFSTVAWTAGLLALAVTVARIPLATWTGDYTRLHLPIAELTREMQRHQLQGDVILADHYHLAGVFRLHLPNSVAYGPRDSFSIPPLRNLIEGESALLVWDATRHKAMPGTLRDLAAEAGWPTTNLQADYIERPYRFSTDKTFRLGVVPVQRPSR
ncbi:hypothetical protein Thimo_0856 [Thioflavicoccus mobilis 8321]|uniref:Glycosyltransferase RgtA/B/C/D-like domain-containing protein n=1 Tax=Thioflavicoccus mobilis 8321 TaxID=765912 RepID=L0GV37_9GAMM|nr:glycosyltransferase family 39 protein [Thioflavicoccus mobilis]AGA89692.1 hypothetical protein Thimo_0856 [Thioflavicoccus mobilis 8321]